MIPNLLFGVFQIFQDRKTNPSLLSSDLGLQAFASSEI